MIASRRHVTSRRHMTMRALALAIFLGTIGGALAQGRGHGQPGKFDYYVLSLSWSPSFCESAAGARSQECGARPYSFVVHGLWPQYERGYPESCQIPSPRLDHRIVDQMLDLMPARKLVYHEWDTHGTCSGLDQHAYFDLVRQARGAIKIPPQFDNPQQALEIRPADIVDAFVKANAGLAANGITLSCSGSRLGEVHICLTRDLKFRSCGNDQVRACRSGTVQLPPARGG
jgi:ribonuclease T2